MQRDLIYFSTETIQNFVISAGISAGDFVNGIGPLPRNLLLLNDDYRHANDVNVHTKFSVVRGSRAVKAYLLNAKTAPKKVVDFADPMDLNELLRREIADLLYLGHMGFPMYEAFSSKLQNQYIYLELRSRFLKVYYHNFRRFGSVLNASIKRHLGSVIDRKRLGVLERLGRSGSLVKDLPKSVVRSLVASTSDGTVLAFNRTATSRRRRVFRIPILSEKGLAAQATWNSRDVEANAFKRGSLIYNVSKKRWRLDS